MTRVSTRAAHRRRIASLDRAAPAPLPIATAAPPGSAGKIEELKRRARGRLSLFARGDAGLDGELALVAEAQRNGAAKVRDGCHEAVDERDYRKLGREEAAEKIRTTVASPFAARLRRLRERAGLSRKQLARRAAVSLRCVTFWETGRRRPGFERLRSLAAALGVGVDVLVG
jgi:DNA-binding transcriptional regulator YiaG